MKPRIKVITLGVSDLEKSLAFYRDGMGLPTQGIIGTEFEDGAVVFFEMNDDLILALWPKKSLAKDAGSRESAKPDRILHRSQRQIQTGSRRGDEAGGTSRRQDHRSCARPLLGRVRRILPGFRRTPLGNRLESQLGHQGLTAA